MTDLKDFERDALTTRIFLPKGIAFDRLSQFVKQLREIPEVSVYLLIEKQELDIFVDMDSDYYHGRSPHAAHSWCHGWIVRGIIEMITEELTMIGADDEYEWKQIRWIPNRRQTVRVDDVPVGFELKKVPLHA